MSLVARYCLCAHIYAWHGALVLVSPVLMSPVLMSMLMITVWGIGPILANPRMGMRMVLRQRACASSTERIPALSAEDIYFCQIETGRICLFSNMSADSDNSAYHAHRVFSNYVERTTERARGLEHEVAKRICDGLLCGGYFRISDSWVNAQARDMLADGAVELVAVAMGPELRLHGRRVQVLSLIQRNIELRMLNATERRGSAARLFIVTDKSMRGHMHLVRSEALLLAQGDLYSPCLERAHVSDCSGRAERLPHSVGDDEAEAAAV